MVDEDVALPDHGEEVDGFVPSGSEPRLGHRRPGRVVQIRPLEGVHGPQPLEPQWSFDAVHVVGSDLQLAREEVGDLGAG